MLKRIVKKGSTLHALLTETLPYETPIIFSNEGFYDYLLSEDSNEFIDSILQNQPNSAPYTYQINKNSTSLRELSIPHPSSQLSIASLYCDYEDIILHLCKRSKTSLRHPARVASAYYEKKHSSNFKTLQNNIELDEKHSGIQAKFASSYFAYKKYNFLHKFLSSYEFHHLEKKHCRLLTFDIAKCFQSIYTHSISWAIKGKNHAKRFKYSHSFDTRIDIVMNSMNDQETHGILVGPEFSRIFAEIILQSIDKKAINDIEKEHDLIHEKDFSVRRYVDDYYVFYSNIEIKDIVLRSFIKHLAFFKLYINDSKTDDIQRPFITAISVAKIEAIEIANQVCDSIFDKKVLDSQEAPLRKRDSTISSKHISTYKTILKRNQVKYEDISRITLSVFGKKLCKFLKETTKEKLDIKCSEKVKRAIWTWTDIIFFIYTMSIMPRTTHILSKAIHEINAHAHALHRPDIEDIYKKIFDECRHIIRNKSSYSNSCIEIFNLLITLKTLISKTCHSIDITLAFFNSEATKAKINQADYFTVVSLLYCIADNDGGSSVVKDAINAVKVKFDNTPEINRDTEGTLLLFDMLSCPYISPKDKKELFDRYLQSSSVRLAQDKRKQARDAIAKRNWFIDWGSNSHFSSILDKKELRTPY